MDWWQAAGLMGTFVATGVGVMALGWRMVENLRRESREAHAKIGEQITRVRSDLSGEIAALREGQTRLREGLGGDSRRTDGRDPLGGRAAAGLSRARLGTDRGGVGLDRRQAGIQPKLGRASAKRNWRAWPVTDDNGPSRWRF